MINNLKEYMKNLQTLDNNCYSMLLKYINKDFFEIKQPLINGPSERNHNNTKKEYNEKLKNHIKKLKQNGVYENNQDSIIKYHVRKFIKNLNFNNELKILKENRLNIETYIKENEKKIKLIKSEISLYFFKAKYNEIIQNLEKLNENFKIYKILIDKIINYNDEYKKISQTNINIQSNSSNTTNISINKLNKIQKNRQNSHTSNTENNFTHRNAIILLKRSELNLNKNNIKEINSLVRKYLEISNKNIFITKEINPTFSDLNNDLELLKTYKSMLISSNLNKKNELIGKIEKSIDSIKQYKGAFV